MSNYDDVIKQLKDREMSAEEVKAVLLNHMRKNGMTMPDINERSIVGQQSQRPSVSISINFGLIMLSITILLCFSLYFWMNRYQYEHLRNGVITRNNRFTGKTEMYAGYRGWIKK